ncbi:MAG TPA: heme-binding protein [Maribacter sp.]|uniref:HEAT repeat domain-containing protein n=1 Tax=unclassified Maribacter TaxID=2615042 RepID=UPI000EDE8B44|nr:MULTISPECIES: HEAT repeat domain-containing protein [unclassified Maribacter]HAF76337.1 heme-binding protein [Maribacter sp.]|tara:strand:+ start:1378 stop:4809 length:3432 start_codon:yes stop_codon:yes gene_type:complete
MTFFKKFLLGVIVLLFFSISCINKKPVEIPLTIQQDSTELIEMAKLARETITAEVADGLELSLWASDSLAPDPIALDIDNEGNVYITRTNRAKNSEFDIRGHRDWMTESISLESVEDRRAFLHKTFAPEFSKENEWLPDLNNDSIHDWQDLAVEQDEIWMLQDTDNDGIADISTQIMNDFSDEINDVAGALLVRDNDVFVGIGPGMYRLTDTNGDKILDEKTSIAEGFAVHIGFSGHGMSGAIEGPDGKIYWGIGDIGANITTVDGENHKYPNEGVIVRSNPDGSDFEVFAHGLRNTHEFVFDAYGNIISSDNDGDHKGESERLVHIVEGSDAGWRANWQYGKYTDPKNNGYNVWMDEKLFTPHWDGQAAYIIPPIQNFHNGPTGMRYNPGTALGKKWMDKFFLVEFVGDPSRSHIWSFDLKPKGASFELKSEESILSGVLPTGIDFGPDGALYLADWVNGWGTKNYGRVWKLDVTDQTNDLEQERLETQRLMTHNYEDDKTDNLIKLLSYDDMRIRQKAQFELAKRTFWGYRALEKALTEEENQFARIHAIWGIGQIAAKDVDDAEPLLNLLSDEDAEIIAQSAKVLGDVRYGNAADSLIALTTHQNDRVKFYAAQALGRLKHENAIEPLLAMIEANNDQDLYLRHAAVLALARIGKAEPILALANNENRSLRIAAVLVLRKLQDPKISIFLSDKDEYIVTEAARAINDDLSIEAALPALAATLNNEKFTSEPLLRRAINAALRVGGDEQLDFLINFAKRKSVSSDLRGEALAALGTWNNPSLLDRVDGRYRGEIIRQNGQLEEKIRKDIPSFLNERQPEILIGISKTLSAVGITDYNNELFSIFRYNKSAEVRATVLNSLGQLKFEQMETAMSIGMKDSNEEVRTAAVGLLAQLNIPKEKLPSIVDPIFKRGSISEQQRMLNVLGDLPVENSNALLSSLINKASKDQLKQGILLDLMESVNATENPKLIAQLDKLKEAGYSADSFQETLYGGNWWAGRSVFNNNPTAQCVRCHSVNGSGGEVGPKLDNIGNILNRQQLLEALIEPSIRLAPGYGTVTITLKDGQKVQGVLIEENDKELLLRTSEAEPLRVPLMRIASRENSMSAMPAMGRMISRRELRDLIEYLGSLRNKKRVIEGEDKEV